MVGLIVSYATLVITVITWLDELTWAREHAAKVNAWLLARLCTPSTCRYQHNPCRNHRVQGPTRKV